MSEYTFPFDTCETPRKKGIAQPYSAFCNLISCIIIFYFIIQTKHLPAFLLLLSILCFQLVHLFSHCIHIHGYLQMDVIHGLAWVINLTFFYFLYSYTHIWPSTWFMTFLISFASFDLFAFCYLPAIFYIGTQSILLSVLLLYYLRYLSKSIQRIIYYIIVIVGIVTLLLLNEEHNGKRMMAFYPFPYHIFVEISGIILFYLICSTFYKL